MIDLKNFHMVYYFIIHFLINRWYLLNLYTKIFLIKIKGYNINFYNHWIKLLFINKKIFNKVIWNFFFYFNIYLSIIFYLKNY